MAVTINGNGTITGYTPAVANGSITTAKLADGAVTAVKKGAGSVLQIVQSDNDLALVSGITSTSFAVSASGPYVNITPIRANSTYKLEGRVFGAFNGNTLPVLAFGVSTDNGSNWTHNIQSKGTTTITDGQTGSNNYGQWMTWGDLPEWTVFYSGLYFSTLAANASNIRFGISYRNIYHNSSANAFNLFQSDDVNSSLIVTEIAT